MDDETLLSQEEELEADSSENLWAYEPNTQEEKRRLWCLLYAGQYVINGHREIVNFAEACEAFLINGTVTGLRVIK